MNPLLVLADPPPDNEGAEEWPRIVRTVWRGIAPHALRKRVFAFRRQRREARTMSRVTRVPLAHLMLGDQGGEPANRYAQLVRDWLYPSRSIAASPHVALLQEFEQRGDEVLADSFLPTTAYYRLAADCIRVTGQYRDATRPADIRDEVRRFLGDYRAEKARVASQQPPAAERPLEVRKIAHSECFQIVDGHHRAAIAHQLGATDISAVVTERPVLTLLQAVLLSGSWLQGRFELYQPIDSPELKKKWELVRKCSDRLARIKRFLEQHEVRPPVSSRYLDVGSAYGWFMKQMGDLGFSAYGIERDPAAALVGVMVYGLEPSRVTVEDLVHFLRHQDEPYDVVSCMSVVHHYVMRSRGVGPAEVVSLLDRVTKRVLFFEMGEEHERWYRDALGGWSPDYIAKFLRLHTSFRHIERLGIDEDAVPPFDGNYGRTLFACWR